MSKFLWIISRNSLSKETEKKLETICEELVPENIVPNKSFIHTADRVAFGISNPKNNVFLVNNSLLVGALIGEYPKWYLPKSEYPDGSYAIFREDQSFAEIVADPAASRTIWYYFDDDQLIASTSQLAIVRYIGDFEFNNEAIPWMLSSGTLGPSLSWDKRLERIKPDCSIILNKKAWTIEKRESEIAFNEGNENDSFYENKLKKILEDIFKNLKLDFNNWILPLSGGYDSRALLYFFKEKKIKTITWGLVESLENPENDAYVAKKLAEKAGIQHDYYLTNFSNENLEQLFRKFVKNGEGRIDSVSGYLDNFKIWEDLHNNNVNGIFRGDVGWTSDWKIHSYFSARKIVGLTLTSDYLNLNSFSKNEQLNQGIPKELNLKKGESPELWRDRLYHNFRIPVILASLSDLKLGYVEQISPLLSRELLNFIRTQPLNGRKDKRLFKKIVESMFPEVSFSKSSALEQTKDFLNKPHVLNFLKEKLKSNIENEIFSQDFIKNLIKDLKPPKATSEQKKYTLKYLIKKSVILSRLKFFIKKNFYFNTSFKKEVLANHQIVFRVFLILSVFELFNKGKK